MRLRPNDVDDPSGSNLSNLGATSADARGQANIRCGHCKVFRVSSHSVAIFESSSRGY
jgi:hypothetical protein